MIGVVIVVLISPLPSFGLINGSTTLPRSASPTGIIMPWSLINILSPILNPSTKPKGDIKKEFWSISLTMPNSNLSLLFEIIFTISPILGFNPLASIIFELIFFIVPNSGDNFSCDNLRLSLLMDIRI